MKIRSENKCIRFVGVLLALFVAATVGMQKVEASTFFGSINSDFSKLDQSDAADAFGICAASYEILSVGNNAALFRQFANGTSMALGMLPVRRIIEANKGYQDKKPSNHPQLVASIAVALQAGQMTMESEITTHKTRINSFSSSNAKAFAIKMENTINVCTKNLDFQQEYIDLWRDLVARGWITLPRQ